MWTIKLHTHVKQLKTLKRQRTTKECQCNL